MPSVLSFYNPTNITIQLFKDSLPLHEPKLFIITIYYFIFSVTKPIQTISPPLTLHDHQEPNNLYL